MAQSYTDYVGDGATATFNLSFPFINRSHVKLYVDGVSVSFTWITDSQIQADVAPANLTNVRVKRETPTATREVDWTNGAQQEESDLDLADTQVFYIVQEADDDASEGLRLADDGTFDAQSKRVTNVADGTNDNDAVNKAQVDSLTATAVATCTAQAAIATSEATDAEAFADAAALSEASADDDATQTALDVIATTADVVSTNADVVQTGLDAAATAADLVNTSQDAVDTAADVVQTGLDAAATAADVIQTAADVTTTGTNASTASAAQVAAEAARDATLASFDSFDDRYLGAKTSDPALDNDGDALVAGTLYFNSNDGVMKIYTGSIWVASYVSGADFLAKANNLSDIANATTARANLGLIIGTNVQAFDAVLDATTASFTATLKTKLDAIAPGATANDTDANLKNRANHTGTQLMSSVSDAGSAATLDVGTAANEIVQLDGSAKLPAVDGSQLTNLPSAAPEYLIIEDQKTSGTGGGTFNSGAWRDRDLNTTVLNEITGASLASNQITLPAGTYEIASSHASAYVNAHQAKLYNVTDSADEILGPNYSSSAASGAPQATGTNATVEGKFTIVGTKVFKIQHRCMSSRGGNGLGLAGSWGTEIYSRVVIKKIG